MDIKGAGKSGLGLSIEGPAEAQVSCKDNQDGTCSVEYLPKKAGDYDISVMFAEQHIPGRHICPWVKTCKVVTTTEDWHRQNLKSKYIYANLENNTPL